MVLLACGSKPPPDTTEIGTGGSTGSTTGGGAGAAGADGLLPEDLFPVSQPVGGAGGEQPGISLGSQVGRGARR
jgi:hypothetical protein